MEKSNEMNVSEVSPDSIDELIVKLESRSFTTYKARLEAHLRLTRKNATSNNLLLAFSTATTVAAVGMLSDRNMYGSGGDALMVALAVVALVASLVVASANYGVRSKSMEASYKEIQRISLRVENLKHGLSDGTKAEEYLKLQEEYMHAINSSENHKARDYRVSQGGKQYSRFWSYCTFLVPAVLLIPFVKWYFDGFGPPG